MQPSQVGVEKLGHLRDNGSSQGFEEEMSG
jgi:hypothetical protein